MLTIQQRGPCPIRADVAGQANPACHLMSASPRKRLDSCAHAKPSLIIMVPDGEVVTEFVSIRSWNCVASPLA